MSSFVSSEFGYQFVCPFFDGQWICLCSNNRGTALWCSCQTELYARLAMTFHNPSPGHTDDHRGMYARGSTDSAWRWIVDSDGCHVSLRWRAEYACLSMLCSGTPVVLGHWNPRFPCRRKISRHTSSSDHYLLRSVVWWYLMMQFNNNDKLLLWCVLLLLLYIHNYYYFYFIIFVARRNALHTTLKYHSTLIWCCPSNSIVVIRSHWSTIEKKNFSLPRWAQHWSCWNGVLSRWLTLTLTLLVSSSFLNPSQPLIIG